MVATSLLVTIATVHMTTTMQHHKMNKAITQSTDYTEYVQAAQTQRKHCCCIVV
jgi:hypothetical protein